MKQYLYVFGILATTALFAYGAAIPIVPIATPTRAGLVKGGGDGINIAADGTISATGVPVGGLDKSAFDAYTGQGGGRVTFDQISSLVGPAGQSATITIGATSTGAAGSSATVTNSGTSSAAVFNFTIPRGNTGATGAQGPQGVQGPQGPQGVAGGSMAWRGVWEELVEYYANDAVSYGSPASSYIAIATSIGSAPDASPLSWNLISQAGAQGFRGYSGAQGPQGPEGPQGFRGYSGATGPAGPTGATGPAGPQGANGGELVFKGAWSAFVNYSTLDAVTYNGSSFAAKLPSLNLSPWVPPASPSTPQSNTWQLMAQKGSDGPQGPQGPADTSHVIFSRMTSALSSNTITTQGINSSAADGTRRLNVRNGVTRTYTPAEGDFDTDADGRMWLRQGGAWVEKGADYILPTASGTVKGGVKVGSGLSIDGDNVLSAVGASSLESAVLIGTRTIDAGFAYAATGVFYATFSDATSTKQTSIITPAAFGNFSGVLCAGTGSKLYRENPVTQQAYSSVCAKVPPKTRLVAQMLNGKTLVASTRNLPSIVEAAAPPATCSTGSASITQSAGSSSTQLYSTLAKGQSFTPGSNGTIYSVTFTIASMTGAGDMVCRLGTSSNLSTYLAQETVSVTEAGPQEVVFSDHPALTSGVPYYFGCQMGTVTGAFASYSNANPYAGGTAYITSSGWSMAASVTNDWIFTVKLCD